MIFTLMVLWVLEQNTDNQHITPQKKLDVSDTRIDILLKTTR